MNDSGISNLESEIAPPSRPQLTDNAWAVIGDHYLNMNLTHAEALAEAKDLNSRKQHAVVTTNEAAQQMIQNNAGLSVASPPDVKF